MAPVWEGAPLATATSEPVFLPPGPRTAKAAQGIAFLAARHGVLAALRAQYGNSFTVNVPIFGRTVVVGDPTLVKELFNTGPDLLGRPARTWGETAGSGSTWNLDGAELVERRRVLAPPFHGRRMRTYEHVVEEQVRCEMASWPEGREFAILPAMRRITLSAILRAVFGAEGPALDELRALLPPAVSLGARLVLLPAPVRHDLGQWSPGGRFLQYRRRIDALIYSLIAEARADPSFEERNDVLALLLQARYSNGDAISDPHIADELLTLLTAGHESTSTTLAWIVERIRRHPLLLSRLTDEVDAGGSQLRQATIWEAQRTRPVVDTTLRGTKKRIRLGQWVIPEDTTVMIALQLAHEATFPDAASFNPDRFVGTGSTPVSWNPFGGGVFRCPGAAFANMEMDVTLRTMLREFWLVPTNSPGERRHSRGVAIAPARGGRAVFHRRTADFADRGTADRAHQPAKSGST
jgi:cytochrome P450